jgi:glycosyltransferase involved in cell wall biosynthesis
MQSATAAPPKVTIGMPVYNGERFLRDTLESLLTQTFGDFELVISDNGSTDGTQAICREYAARDSRIRYFREEINRGAGWNYNRVVEVARGIYFKWAAHDDLCAPTYLERCVAVLDNNPDVVLAYPDDIDIDEEGNRINRKRAGRVPMAERAASEVPSRRFRLLVLLDYDCEQVFGLIRIEILRKTKLILNYTDSDRTLLAELGLYGVFYEIPEPLFFHRHHSGSSGRAFPVSGGWHLRAAWFDPRLKERVLFPQWRQLWEYFKAIWRTAINPVVKIKCLFWLGVGYRRRVRSLMGEFVWGMHHLLIGTSTKRRDASPVTETHG